MERSPSSPAKASEISPAQMRETLQRVVNACRMSDGSVPTVTYMLVTDEELRVLWAVQRIVDAYEIQRDHDAKRSRGKR